MSSTDPGKVLFSEWASDKPVMATDVPGPCSVCGAKAGLCTEDHGQAVQVIRTAQRRVRERITRNE